MKCHSTVCFAPLQTPYSVTGWARFFHIYISLISSLNWAVSFKIYVSPLSTMIFPMSESFKKLQMSEFFDVTAGSEMSQISVTFCLSVTS